MGLTSSDLCRLSHEAQRQVMDKLTAKQRTREAKGRKYHNRPAERVMPDGTVRMFDSEHEATRYDELRLLEKAGEIVDLQCQKRYRLLPAQTKKNGKVEKPVDYIADFVYRDGIMTVVEDAKGFKTPEYVIKRKLMLYTYGIEIREV